MAITFYAASGSPFVWRVWLALEHKGLPYDLKLLSFSGGDLKTPEFRAINPRGRVPGIADGGFTLYESAAIVEYLDEAYPTKPVLPGNTQAKARLRRLIAEVDWYLDKEVGVVGDEILWKTGPADEAKLAAALQKIHSELEFFSSELRGDWLGDQLSAADYALYATLAFLLRITGKKRPDLGVEASMPARLMDWKRRIELLPYYQKTYPPHWRDG
ncbi:glutathione S-transferase family protein [Chitinimonas sp. PSY-7]|uniref:glutathione S-transferase N-terminal domain-containing protein n=1 Tax=Chitinimonas sp. PSY-7 TaxID=3459088 RepID=UPI00403FDB53